MSSAHCFSITFEPCCTFFVRQNSSLIYLFFVDIRKVTSTCNKNSLRRPNSVLLIEKNSGLSCWRLLVDWMRYSFHCTALYTCRPRRLFDIITRKVWSNHSEFLKLYCWDETFQTKNWIKQNKQNETDVFRFESHADMDGPSEILSLIVDPSTPPKFSTSRDLDM